MPRDQHALAGDAGRVELEELHVHQRDAGTQGHRGTVAGVDVRVGGRAEDLAPAAGGEQGGLGFDQERLAGLDLEHQRTADHPFGVADQIDGEELVEEVGARADVLLIEGMQDRVTGAVGRRTGARRLIAAEVLALAAEGALVDLAVVQTREGHAGVLELVDRRDGLATHELDGVLVTQIIRALDRVEHVPVPGVRHHVGERGVHPALGGDRVRARRKDLGDDGNAQIRAGQLQRGVQTRAPGTDDECVEMTCWNSHAWITPADPR